MRSSGFPSPPVKRCRMSSSRPAATARSNTAQKAVVQRRYQKQDEACSQAIKVLLAKAAGVSSSNGDDAKKGSHKHEFRAATSLPR